MGTAIGRDVINLARKATDAAEDQWAKAYDLLTKDRWVNGAGVYTDKLAILGRLADLEAAAAAARRALHGIPWPVDADYEER